MSWSKSGWAYICECSELMCVFSFLFVQHSSNDQVLDRACKKTATVRSSHQTVRYSVFAEGSAWMLGFPLLLFSAVCIFYFFGAAHSVTSQSMLCHKIIEPLYEHTNLLSIQFCLTVIDAVLFKYG